MKFISDTMFLLSNGLLIPVIIGLLLLFLLALLMLGGLIERAQRYKRLQRRYFAHQREDASALLGRLRQELGGESQETARLDLFEELLRSLLTAPAAERSLLIGEYELRLDKRLVYPQVLTKFGPILGLMGTLIPMGPALVGLSSGDMATMAYNMQVAFATTVLGLFVSAIGYLTLQRLHRYHHHELIYIDYIDELLTQAEDETKK